MARQAAGTAVRTANVLPITFEQFGGRDADPENAYLGEVETPDIYIGILGRRYGKPLPTRFSATHTEYLHAEKSGLRMAVWCLRTDDREGHEQAILDELRIFHVVPEFASPDDLRAQIEDRLKVIAAEDLAPWCKLGTVVFRAAEVSDGGDEIRVAVRLLCVLARSDDFPRGLCVENPRVAAIALQQVVGNEVIDFFAVPIYTNGCVHGRLLMIPCGSARSSPRPPAAGRRSPRGLNPPGTPPHRAA